MPHTLRLKKGLDIKIVGEAERIIAGDATSEIFGVKPIDFPGLTPKLDVNPGDKVKAGSPLFHDKLRPQILFTSPVSGTVKSIERGDRRKILEVIIAKEGSDYIDFGKVDPSALSRETIISLLLNSGLWPAVRQRPYHIIANPGQKPKSVFVSGFDTSPLAPDYNFIFQNTSQGILKTGFNALTKLTDGKVHLALKGNTAPPEFVKDLPGVEISFFTGPHPAGNVGVQIHHLDHVNKGEVVWYVNLQDVITIGRLLTDGIYKPEKIVALCGSEVLKTGYYRTLSGSSITTMVKENVKAGNLRYISGNVLTGSKIAADGYLGYYDSQVTVIPEGDYFDFFGWASPGINKYSFSRTFLSGLIPGKRFRLDTNMHGGERAFVMTGQYEKVVPMDIFPMQLFKAILAGDIDMMENLGIYEVAEEDFALCEFICPSKIEIQSIVRKGIEMMIKEMQ